MSGEQPAMTRADSPDSGRPAWQNAGMDLSPRAAKMLDDFRRTGTAHMKASVGKLLLLLLVSIGFAVAGAWMMVDAIATGTSALNTAFSGNFWIGLVAVVFFGILGIPGLGFQLVRRGHLALDREGFTESRGGTTPLRILWKDITEIRLQAVGADSNHLVCVTMSPHAYSGYADSLGKHERAMLSTNEKIIGHDTVALANVTSLKAKDVAALLVAALQETESPRG